MKCQSITAGPFSHQSYPLRSGGSQNLRYTFAGDPLEIAFRASLRQVQQQSPVLYFSSWASILVGLSGIYTSILRTISNIPVPASFPLIILGQFILGTSTYHALRKVKGNLHTLHYLLTGKGLFSFYRLPKLAKTYRTETLPSLIRQANRRKQLFSLGGGILGERVGKQIAVARGWEGIKAGVARIGGAGWGALSGFHLAQTMNTFQRQMAQRKLLTGLRIIY